MSFEEQYCRVIRWYGRFQAINDGLVHSRPSDNYMDEIYSFFQNCYHLKDWIKNDPLSGFSNQQSEDCVNNSGNLKLCADLCNAQKHLTLHTMKTGAMPQQGPRQFHLQVGGEPVLSIRYDIASGSTTVDAFTLATDCVNEWYAILTQKGHIVPHPNDAQKLAGVTDPPNLGPTEFVASGPDASLVVRRGWIARLLLAMAQWLERRGNAIVRSRTR